MNREFGREDEQMNHKNGRVVACVLGIDSQTETDVSQWKLPFVLQLCAAEDPAPNHFERTDEMTQLEAAGFVPLALVTTDADGQAGLGLMIRDDLPALVRQYLTSKAQEIFQQASKNAICDQTDH